MRCLCGRTLEVERGEDEKRHQCPYCTRKFECVVQDDPETGKEIAFPMFVEDATVSGDTMIAAALRPGDQTPPPTPRKTPVVCRCGKTLMIGAETFGKTIRCKTCNARMVIKASPDGKGGVTVAPQMLRSEKLPVPDFIRLACLCGAGLELDRKAGASVACELCGRRVSLFFEGDDPMPMFVDKG